MEKQREMRVPLPENLKKQMALAVRSIQWSYAIFWSISPSQPGVLKWREGHYNGDFKTRKTVQSTETNRDELGLQRSEELRELYESLSDGEAQPQSRRPSAALSPEDLTDAEWYYLVCMSFVFNIGQGLPGRTLADGQLSWLCNAHYADNKIFNRSMLAKSASIQTVVCFPLFGGVVELGVTELVLEDPSLIQHIKTSILETPYPGVSNKSNPSTESRTNDKDLDTRFIPVVESKELMIASAKNSSIGFELNQSADESYSNFCDCISQTFAESEKENHSLQDHQDLNHRTLATGDIQGDDLHYQSVLSGLLKSTHQLIFGPHFQNCIQKSSFMRWKKGGLMNIQIPKSGNPQKLLKKILFEVPRMHDGRRDGVWRPEADEVKFNHVLSERKRREKLTERFLVLRSLIPSISKVDKVSILDDTIEHLKELERRVEELESCPELEARTQRKSQDTVEGTSDNYGNHKITNGKKPLINKRKASDIDDTEAETNYFVSKDVSNASIRVNKKDVIIEIRCGWREGALLEIMDAVSNLHLDSHSVQSSTDNGVLSLIIKSKFKGSAVPLVGMIKQALQRVGRKC